VGSVLLDQSDEFNQIGLDNEDLPDDDEDLRAFGPLTQNEQDGGISPDEDGYSVKLMDLQCSQSHFMILRSGHSDLPASHRSV
jgi:hypothetical protein